MSELAEMSEVKRIYNTKILLNVDECEKRRENILKRAIILHHYRPSRDKGTYLHADLHFSNEIEQNFQNLSM